MELTIKQFEELQELLLNDSDSGIYYYVHRSQGDQIAIYKERLRYSKRLFKNVGLVHNISKDERAGYWRIGGGFKYFKQQSNFVEIKPMRR